MDSHVASGKRQEPSSDERQEPSSPPDPAQSQADHGEHKTVSSAAFRPLENVLSMLMPKADPTAIQRPSSTKATIINLTRERSSSVRSSESFSSFHGASPGHGTTELQHALHGMKNLIVSVNFLQTYISRTAKVFCFILLLCAIGWGTVGTFILVKSFQGEGREVIEELNVCFGQEYNRVKADLVTYNTIIVLVNALFILWFALRAVRLEKEGLVFCFLIVALIQIGRSMHLAFVILPTSPSIRLSIVSAAEISFSVCVGMLIISFALAIKVYSDFGWRLYTKGVTHVEHVAQMRRFKQFDAVVKLDTFACVNTFVSIFFLTSGKWVRGIGFAVSSVTIAVLLFVSTAVKRHLAWFGYLFVSIALMLPAFHLYILITVAQWSKNECVVDFEHAIQRNNISIHAHNSTSAHKFRVIFPSPDIDSGWLPTNCIGLKGDEYSNCLDAQTLIFSRCCAAYGRCTALEPLRDDEATLTTLLAVVGILIRVLTLIFGFRQLRDLSMPSVRELFARGERNLREFSNRVLSKDSKPEGESTVDTEMVLLENANSD